MPRLFSVVVALCALAALCPVASAAGAPYCQPGEVPAFRFGFAALKSQLGVGMGDPAECEHDTGAGGNTWIKTITGLAFYHKSTNTSSVIVSKSGETYHWALTPNGVAFWQAESTDSADPPESASIVSDSICRSSVDATPPFDPLRAACIALLSTELGDPFAPSTMPEASPTTVLASTADASTYPTRKGQWTFDQLKNELSLAGYPGPWDIASVLNAYERAAAPTPTLLPTATPRPANTPTPDYSGSCFQVSSNLAYALIFPSSTVYNWCISNAQRDGARGVQCTQYAVQQSVDLINLVVALKLTQNIQAPSLDTYYNGCLGR